MDTIDVPTEQVEAADLDAAPPFYISTTECHIVYGRSHFTDLYHIAIAEKHPDRVTYSYFVTLSYDPITERAAYQDMLLTLIGDLST